MNNKLKNILLNKYNNQTLAHFYLITPSYHDEEKKSLQWCEGLIAEILKKKYIQGDQLQHEDILYSSPHSDKYNNEHLREISTFLTYKPTVLDTKFILITDGDKLLESHLNKLLKTLEEPPIKVCIFFINPSKKALLPTILSRSVELRINITTNTSRPENIFFDLGTKSFVQLQKEVTKSKISSLDIFNQFQIFTQKVIKQQSLKPKAQSKQDNLSLNKLINEIKSIETDLLYNNSAHSILLKSYETYLLLKNL